MAILAYDDVMLREPGLLVPGMAPLGLVKPSELIMPFNPVFLTCGSMGGMAWTKNGYIKMTQVGDAKIEAGNYTFPGTNGYYSFGSTSYVDHTKQFTVIGSTRLSSFGNAFPIIAAIKNGNTGSNTVLMYSNDASYADFCIKPWSSIATDASRFVISDVVTVLGTWHHWVARLVDAGTNNTLSINGVGKSRTALSGGLAASTGDNRLGQRSNDTTYDFYGDIGLFMLVEKLLPLTIANEISSNVFVTVTPA